MFQHRDKHDDVRSFAFEVWQRLFDCPLIEREFLQCLQLGRAILKSTPIPRFNFGSKAINCVAR